MHMTYFLENANKKFLEKYSISLTSTSFMLPINTSRYPSVCMAIFALKNFFNIYRLVYVSFSFNLDLLKKG